MVVIPASMGLMNKRTLLGRLQRVRHATRAALAKSLGMSQPTAGKIVEELLALGILEEAGEGDHGNNGHPPRLGRPGRLLRLDRAQVRFLAIELGVQETRLAAVPLGLGEMDRWDIVFATPASAADWECELRTASSRLKQSEFWGVLISVPGLVDDAAGRVIFSPNLHWTEHQELPQLLRRVWGSPVELVQEERALALGHQVFDANTEDFLLVDFGDGVGGAAVVGGRLYNNPLPISGELGHTPVIGNTRVCGCGAQGCVETLISVRGLLESCPVEGGGQAATWEMLQARIRKHGVEPWLRRALDATSVVIAGALNVLGLRRVVLTGSLTELPSAVCEYLTEAVLRGCMWARFGRLECRTAPRRRLAGLVAAAIDRLVLPLESGSRTEERSVSMSMSMSVSVSN